MHVNRINFDTAGNNGSCRENSFGLFNRDDDMVAKLMKIVEVRVNFILKRRPNENEIIQDMRDCSDLEFIYGYPLKGRTEGFKNGTRRSTTHKKTLIEKELIIKDGTKKMSVIRSNGNDTEGVLDVTFSHKTRLTKLLHQIDYVIQVLILHCSILIRNEGVYRRGMRKGEIMN